MTAIVDYGAGNLTSVRYAFAACGVEAAVTRDPEVIRAADRVVFPGVGAAKSAMENLRALGLVEAVRAAAEAKPFLGICLGMQILFAHSEEDGGVETLGVLPGRVRRFPAAADFKVPEMGWNQVRFVGAEGRDGEEEGQERREELEGRKTREGQERLEGREASCPSCLSSPTSRLASRATPQTEYYFVHSYYAEIGPYTAGITDYAGVEFTAFARKGRLWACQFHPEKSGRVGLDLIKEWLSC